MCTRIPVHLLAPLRIHKNPSEETYSEWIRLYVHQEQNVVHVT